MKLYATTTSERASKGQGGNNFLDLEIMGENQIVLARIKVTNPYPYEYNVDVFPVAYWEKSLVEEAPYDAIKLTVDVKGHGYRLKRIETKGNKKKDNECGHDKCKGLELCIDNIPL